MSIQRGQIPTDQESELVGLIAGFRQGVVEAGEELQAIVRSAVSKRVRRCDVTPQEAEELVQESILHVFARLHEYSQEKGSFDAWLGGFAMNSVRAHRRRISRLRTRTMPADDSFQLSYEIDVNGNDQELLGVALSSLDLLDQELLHMKYSLGMSSEEIAARSDLNPPQVRKRISRAVERLRRHPSVQQVIA